MITAKLDFKRLQIEDRPWVTELLKKSDFQGCEYTFGNMYMWNAAFGSLVTRYKDFLITRNEHDGCINYCFPAGEGDLRGVIDIMIEEAMKTRGCFNMFGITDKTLPLLESLYPGRFEYQANEDYFDYIYNASDLISLAGRKYHAKRNHIAAFEKNNDYIYEDITPDNIRECVHMNEEWEKANRDRNPDGMDRELTAIHRAFGNFFEIGLQGGILRLGGRIVAYTAGERLNSNTFCIHIEKAFSGVQGAYAMINREFAARNLGGYEYINREEDMGVEGLRKAKQSYHPAVWLKKYKAVCRGNGS